MRSIKEISDSVLAETKKIIVAKDEEIRLVIMAILSNGHVLLEDIPGSGKTTLCKTISKALGLENGRIQFVPDLLPSDITGMVVYNQRSGDFELRKGPVMTNVLLADEINRAIPRTQAALLEAMEERQITIDNESYKLPKPFIVLATQNPVEMESTFKLPVAQMDRFLIRLSLGYLSEDDEINMLKKLGDRMPFDDVNEVTNADEITKAIKLAESAYISDEVASYIVRLASETRKHPDVQLGVSPRGSKALYKASKVWAMMEGRDFVTIDDVKFIAKYVLPHRIILKSEARYQGATDTSLIEKLLDKVPTKVDVMDVLNR